MMRTTSGHFYLREKQRCPLTVSEQIENLKLLNLQIDNEAFAAQFLNHVSYFRFIKAYSLGLKPRKPLPFWFCLIWTSRRSIRVQYEISSSAVPSNRKDWNHAALPLIQLLLCHLWRSWISRLTKLLIICFPSFFSAGSSERNQSQPACSVYKKFSGKPRRQCDSFLCACRNF